MTEINPNLALGPNSGVKHGSPIEHAVLADVRAKRMLEAEARGVKLESHDLGRVASNNYVVENPAALQLAHEIQARQEEAAPQEQAH